MSDGPGSPPQEESSPFLRQEAPPSRAGLGARPRYLEDLKELALRPRTFFGDVFLEPGTRRAFLFAMKNGFLLAVGLSVAEALADRSWSWAIVAVSSLLLVSLPILFILTSLLWAFFLRAADALLGENIPPTAARVATAYSTAGLLPLMIGGGWSWLALWSLILQVIGVERALGCSRFKAAVLVFFPFSIASLLFLFFTFMFEVF